MNSVSTEILDGPDAVALAAAENLLEEVTRLQQKQEIVHICLTGGTVGILTLKKIAMLDQSKVDWKRVHVWWGDERFVSKMSPDRNAIQAREAWLNTSFVPESNIHEFPAADELDLEQGAKAFDVLLAGYWSELPRFDIVLLGVGPDGHVASLFPGHEQVIPGTWTVTESDSPKPPAARLSLSYEILNNSNEVWFTVAGADKAEAVAAAFSSSSLLPVARVQSAVNRWFLDSAAASKLLS